MQKGLRAIEIIFAVAWLLCGCSIDSVCDDWRATVVFIIALVTIFVCAAVLGHDTK